MKVLGDGGGVMLTKATKQELLLVSDLGPCFITFKETTRDTWMSDFGVCQDPIPFESIGSADHRRIASTWLYEGRILSWAAAISKKLTVVWREYCEHVQ